MSCFVPRSGSAQSPDEAQHKAASLFDRGVQEFTAQRYEAAAGSFLAADDTRGSREALINALAAAQRGSLPLLSARAATRLLARSDLDEPTRASTQTALERVLPQVARLELQCAPAPCTLHMDGEPTRTGSILAQPGSHALLAENAAGARAVTQVQCGAGAVCPVTLTLAAPEPVLAALDPSAPEGHLRAPSDAPDTAVPAASPLAEAPPRRGEDRLPLGVFIAATTGAALFAALTTWSGVEAVQARRLYETHRAAYDDDEVRKHARRADGFLAGSLVCAGAALATGLFWVDFGARKRAKLTLAPWLRGGVLAEGHF